VDLRHLAQVRTIISKVPANSKSVEDELRKLRATGKRIASNKKLARRLLVATGMYTLKGGLKPQFR
jgi:hypothetical protein